MRVQRRAATPTGSAQKALLGCGIAAPLVYLASDVMAGLRWEGYSFRDQTISELNAIGASTRALTIALGLVGYTFLAAYGVGVWRAAALNRRLRVVGGALFVVGVLSLWAVPFASMHVREAEESFTDTLHLVGGAIVGPLLLVVIGFGASVFGKRYRLYSIATILVVLAFAAWMGMDGAAITDNLATPWVGVKERILAGPVGTHAYWALGGTWGLHQSTSTGIRVVAVVVIMLLVAAVLVVLARVGLWQQAFVSDRVIRFFAWALAGVFLVETLAAFTWSRGEPEWWLYGPVSLVIALLALVVAGLGSAWPRLDLQHRTLRSR